MLRGVVPVGLRGDCGRHDDPCQERARDDDAEIIMGPRPLGRQTLGCRSEWGHARAHRLVEQWRPEAPPHSAGRIVDLCVCVVVVSALP